MRERGRKEEDEDDNVLCYASPYNIIIIIIADIIQSSLYL